MIPDDEMIHAWLDGRLDEIGDMDGAARMTELAANDEAFARKVQRLRHLDDLVRLAVPEEPEIPAVLLERLGLSEPRPGATIVDLTTARQERAARQAVSAAPSRFGRSAFMKMAAQVALIAGVGLAVAVIAVPGQRSEDPSAEYRVLGSPAEPAARDANVLIKFSPGLAAGEERRIAADAGLRLIGAPSSTGAWKAAIAPVRRDAVLQALRTDQRIMMAEPIDKATP